MYREQYHDNRYDKHINIFPPNPHAPPVGAPLHKRPAEVIAPYPLEDANEVINAIPVYTSMTPPSARPQVINTVEASSASGASSCNSSNHANDDRYDRPFQFPTSNSSHSLASDKLPTSSRPIEEEEAARTKGQERIPPPPYEESESRILQEKAYRTEDSIAIEKPETTPPRERKRELSQYSPSGLKFYEIYKRTVSDSTNFTPEIQMKWCEALLEFAFDDEFLRHYNINAEKLKRELKPEEMLKNQKVILEHSFKVLTKLITLKWGPAMYLMGTLYSHQPYLKIKNKSIVTRNDKKALEYYCRSANCNHADACYRAGVCYEFQKGVTDLSHPEKALTTAFQYYRRGAELCSNSACMYKLGMFCLYRDEFQDVPQAIEWFKRAAKQGDSPQALYEMGKIYEFTGLSLNIQELLAAHGIERHPSRALKLFYKCATDSNYTLAQWKLGHCYEFGELQLPVMAKKSIAWYAKAALAQPKGNAMAMLALSGWYLTGATGVLQPNDKEAFRWAFNSCEASDGKLGRAEYALAYFYEKGVGCQCDLRKAKNHYERAAKLGHLKAINRLQDTFQ